MAYVPFYNKHTMFTADMYLCVSSCGIFCLWIMWCFRL